MQMDDELLVKLVKRETGELRDATGQAPNEVAAYTPVSFTARGQVD